ncbi:LytR family transcriptional regulator [Streptomyces sp. SID8379]|uniref:LCP family protein n=1 Tax=unclassified Streptomyces TaxID=2593676 RepID=UPI00036999F6|nr:MULTISPECIES: LCP family protein [unclassified Streptomyces]MYW63096.1 LytR family transcriptional regulator [Streptomyces sp. SID8379]
MPHESGDEHRAHPADAPAVPAYGPARLRRSRHRKRKRALRWIAGGTLGAVLVGGGGVAYAWQHLNGNIKGTDVNAALGSDRPGEQHNGAMNILLLGSDSRAGTHGQYGSGVVGARADTAMVLHVDKTHKKASVVSIPRDTLVQRPSCDQPHGGTVPPEQAMFNSSYALGGPACTVKTVEKMSGLRMDHYLEVDFKGFQKLIDELGGVDITTRTALHDRGSGLSLDSGKHRLKGKEALALVRTRHAVGDGSDLGRIQLQQAFIKALIHRADTVDPLGSPAKSYALADTATKSVSADSELASAGKLLGLAKELKGISPDRTTMVTMPVTYDAQDAGRVLPLEKASHRVWKALRHDQPVPKTATRGSVADRTDTPVVSGT